MEKPSIFIGSSKEGLDVARAIQHQLHEDANAVLWNEGTFALSYGYLESLIRALDIYQFAILIFRADDMLMSKNLISRATRGNVLFELGLFMGRLGRKRTFVVYDAAKTPSIISDLAGVTFAPYEEKANVDLLTAVSPACFTIREAIKRVLHESSQEELSVSGNHPAMRSYYEYIDGIYKNHFREVGKDSSPELICQQAGKVYDQIHRTNCDIGLSPSKDQYDHTLAYYIAAWIKSNKNQNPFVAKLKTEKLAERITNHILLYIKGLRKA